MSVDGGDKASIPLFIYTELRWYLEKSCMASREHLAPLRGPRLQRSSIRNRPRDRHNLPHERTLRTSGSPGVSSIY